MEEVQDENLSGIAEIDDLDDETEEYPADHELVEDPESLAGDEVDDSFLDTDGDGIPNDEDDSPLGGGYTFTQDGVKN